MADEAPSALPLGPAELEAVLEGLADAVHVHDAQGQTIYANAAAVRLMGLGTSEEATSARPGELAARFLMTSEDGRPVEVPDFPGRRLFLGVEDPEPITVCSLDLRTGRQMWTTTKASAIRDASGRPVYAVNVIEDVTASKQAERRATLLAEAGAVLNASLELGTTLQRVADLAVPGLADWCGVDLPPERGDVVRPSAVAHVDPEKIALGRELRARWPVRLGDETVLAAVLRGEADRTTLPEVTDEAIDAAAQDEDHARLLRAIGFRHIIVLPLRPAGQTIGALTLVRGPGRPPFSEDDVELADELARRAGAAVLNAQLYAARKSVSEALQRSLLPAPLPEVEGLTMAAHYRPAGEGLRVGGDFYDAYPVPDGWLLVIGDVTGKGAEAASLTGLARSALEAVATLTGRPALALAHLNGLLARRGDMALCSAATVHLRTGGAGTPATATVHCAGHPPPLLLRAGEVLPIGRSGPLLGAFAGRTWPELEVVLEEGDVVVLHTDGVPDAVGADGRLGFEGVETALHGAAPGDAAGAVARLRGAVDAHEVGRRRDDVAILAFAVTGPVVRGEAPMPLLASLAARVELDGSSRSVAVARRALDEHVRGRLPEDGFSRARLMLSELASNAVKHGPGAYVVTFDLDPWRLRVEVEDRGEGFGMATAGLRRMPAPEDAAEGGYGLGIVDRLADRWGVEHAGSPARTVVWFELDRPAS